MGLETGTIISDLVATNPTSTDKVRQGDDHIRLLKSTILATFPNITGVITPTHTELNYVDGVTSAIQTQLDAKLAAATADGAGLTESAGVLAVGAGNGIAVNADNVAIDLSSLTAIEANALAATDGFLVDDAGTPKRMEYTDGGLRVLTVSGTSDTLATADMNAAISYTNASAVSVSLNTGVGKVGNWFILIQTGAGQITLGGTSTVNAPIGKKTAAQHSAIAGLCLATDTWVLLGDASA